MAKNNNDNSYNNKELGRDVWWIKEEYDKKKNRG